MNPKIMIVDAHPIYVARIIGFLESLTLNNIVVASGDVPQMVDEQKPDIVILSATLPNQDSLEIARQIQTQHKGSIGVIVQTGVMTSVELIESFKSIGIEHILPRLEKNWDSFQQALTELLASRK